MKTLQQQYNLITEGKGDKTYFMRQALRQFPDFVNVNNTFDQVVTILKGKSIISEAAGGVVTSGRKDWFKLFEAEVKDSNKETDKEVLDTQAHNFDNKDTKNIDNLYGQAFILGYIAEMDDPKNKTKTVDEIKAIVAKNMGKDVNYYFKNSMFSTNGIKGEQLETPKEPKGKYKSSGYSELKESKYSLLEMMDVTEEDLKEASLEEGPLDQQIAAAEKKVEDLKKQVAAAELTLANVKKKEADLSAQA
jgi:hypothetical protein